MVLKQADIGTVYDLVVNTGKLEENYARYYFKQLVSAVSYLHKHNIAHRDIKPLNILLKKSENTVKLADLGHAIDIATLTNGLAYDIKGTVTYRAPEVYNSNGYRPLPADVFSCGVTLFAMVLGIEIFFKSNEQPQDCPWYNVIK
jgi:serine/threonine protein kinase